MLTHEVLGPTTSGNYLVVYETPGCQVPTVTCICKTLCQASTEMDRLNAQQIEREKEIQSERDLCGLNRISHDLGES